MTDETSKILVDDDWKSQVEKEKQMAAEQTTTKTNESPMQLPPASFETLVSMLFTQCLAALGHLPDESGKPTPANKQLAKHFIDTVELLGEKTKGNLSDGEAKMLSEGLHAMRMAFVQVKTFVSDT